MSSFLSKGVFTLMVYPLSEKDTHEGGELFVRKFHLLKNIY
ncbi:hypothetical protein C2W58_01076 [Bacillus pumilus]|jgi:hypothetical protein|uniref:Uncharacterized protein n=1 Tax=Bacillus pumilus TaxID=1408 RepID=A0AB34QUJ1_BACPU|nr:hypothetical protein BAT_3154 [Bacillus pumilus ATCC 7061]KIL17913.1 hypothetical protein B4127_0994 [Bacillus pumilus]RAP07368.1 hypothetical protein C2W58_01076 [Bacillus pumilus]